VNEKSKLDRAEVYVYMSIPCFSQFCNDVLIVYFLFKHSVSRLLYRAVAYCNETIYDYELLVFLSFQPKSRENKSSISRAAKPPGFTGETPSYYNDDNDDDNDDYNDNS